MAGEAKGDAAPAGDAEAARTVLGGEWVDGVEYRKGARKERVFVRELSFRQIHEFAALVERRDTCGLIELCTQKPAGWVDELTSDSAAELSGVCYRLNFPEALRLAKKDPVLAIRIRELVGSAYQAAAGAWIDSSRTLPSSASAAETGSDSSTSPRDGSTP